MSASTNSSPLERALKTLSDVVGSDEFVTILINNASSSRRSVGADLGVSERLVSEMPGIYASLVPLLPQKPDIDQLFTDDDVDGEGLWAQVEMATESLHRGLRKLRQDVTLLGDVEDDEDEGGEDFVGDSGTGSDDDAAEEDAPDEETLQIRERMERAMTGMDGSDSDSDSDSEADSEAGSEGEVRACECPGEERRGTKRRAEKARVLDGDEK